MVSFVGPIQFRRDTSAAWASTNPVLLDGEMGVDTTTRRVKIGDGANSWSALPWVSPDQDTITQILAVGEVIEGATTPTDAVMATVAADDDSAFATQLKTAFVRFVDQNGDPLPAGSLTTIHVNTVTGDIDDITFEEA